MGFLVCVRTLSLLCSGVGPAAPVSEKCCKEYRHMAPVQQYRDPELPGFPFPVMRIPQKKATKLRDIWKIPVP